MLLKHYRQELVFEGDDCYYYIITNGERAKNGILAVNGDVSAPGLNVKLRSIDEEIWKDLRGCWMFDPIDGGFTMNKEARMELLYQLLTTDEREIDGWKITSVSIGEGSLIFDLHNEEYAFISDKLSFLPEKYYPDQTYLRREVEKKVPCSQYMLTFHRKSRKTKHRNQYFEITDVPESDWVYEIGCALTAITVKENSEHCSRELHFDDDARYKNRFNEDCISVEITEYTL